MSDLIEIVNEGWDPHHAVDRNGSTALLWAAGGGHLEVCKYLVETCGVSCNELRGKEKMKRHALHWAARNNQVSVCKWLVNEHAVEVRTHLLIYYTIIVLFTIVIHLYTVQLILSVHFFYISKKRLMSKQKTVLLRYTLPHTTVPCQRVSGYCQRGDVM